jgi:formylglycine-generating enzyme required for sulfatase activity
MMKPVPSATSFVIGSPEFNDAPEHTVDFAAFDVDMTEVTTADYGACVQAGCCTPPATGGLCNYGVSAKDEHPVNCVDWYQADAYCGWANKRLPTEEEWEYVARRPDGRAYPWGAPAPVLGTGQQLCFSQSGTCSVNAFPLGTTEDGVLDMAGNVWEWTATQYCGAYGSNVCATDNRAVRGGSYIDTDDVVFRGAYRYFNGAARGSRFENFGFRCVR